MPEEHVTSNKRTNEKIYLGIIVMLVLALAFLFMNRPDAKPVSQAPTSREQTTPTEPESTSVVEGWSQFPMSDDSKKWFYENKIRTVIFLDDKLQARVADKDGREVKVCARREDGGTGITGECAKMKASTVTRGTNISVEIHESSPGWCRTKVNGRRIYYPC